MTVLQLAARIKIGSACYAHSTGEYYHYRGEIHDVRISNSPTRVNVRSLCVELTHVETMECDIDQTWESRYKPSEITGDWQQYDDVEYLAPLDHITFKEEPNGVRMSFRYAGVVYIPIRVAK